jgi:hypothetical protein
MLKTSCAQLRTKPGRSGCPDEAALAADGTLWAAGAVDLQAKSMQPEACSDQNVVHNSGSARRNRVQATEAPSSAAPSRQ